MQKLFRCLTFAAALIWLATPAAAGELTVQIADGRATIIARDVPLRQILAEWARVGQTRVVNGEKLAGGPITLELVDVLEKDALDILLRSAAGYVAAPRPDHGTGASRFDRVIILASSRPPAANPVAPPQPFNRPVFTQPQPPPELEPDIDEGEVVGEPGEPGPVPPPGIMPPGAQPVPPGPIPPGMDPNEMPQQPAPVTSPRPGLLPQPAAPVPGNPYTPPAGRGGQIRPGVMPGPGAGPVDPDPQ